MGKRFLFAFLLLCLTSTGMAQNETGGAFDLSDEFDKALGESVQINATGTYEKMLNIVLPVSLNLELTDLNKTYFVSLTKAKVLTVQLGKQEADLTVQTREEEVNALFSGAQVSKENVRTFLESENLTLYTYGLKADLAVSNIQELLRLELNVVRKANVISRTVSTIIAKVLGTLNRIFGFVEL